MKSKILLVILATASMASAATMVQTQTFSYIPANSADLSFQRFNPALGTLTSIVITTTVNKSGGSLYVDNESGSTATGNITQTVTINLSSSDVTLLASPSGVIGSNVTATSSYAATTGPDDGDGIGVQMTGSDFDGTEFGPASMVETKTVRPLVHGDYIGAGTYTITASGTQGFNTSAFGGASVAVTPATLSGDVTVTYNYTAVPEPAAALLGGLGLLTLLRRRR